MTNFWQGLGDKLTDQWIAILLTPAFAFWLGGFFAWLTSSGWNSLQTLETWLNQLTPVTLIVLLIVILLVIAVSSNLVQLLNFAMLRGLEGYWPSWLEWLAELCQRWQRSSQDKKLNRYNELEDKEKRSPEEEKERQKLALKVRLFPSNPDKRLPLPLGNILRAAEYRPGEKYGLDAIICWPRLWLLLPDATQKEIAAARAALNSAVLLFLWSLLFLIWTMWAWWVPLVALVVAIVAYSWAMNAAKIHGDLLEAAFDLYRFALYEALRFPPPVDTSTEQKSGKQLTAYLFFGKAGGSVPFNPPSKQSNRKQE